MRVVANEKMIARNAQIGKYASMAGLVVMIGALVVNFIALSRPAYETFTLVSYVLIGFMVGLLLSNFGTVMAQRWGRRTDQRLAETLKMLDDGYVLYNYELGAAHVLAGPSGLFVLLPKYQTGPIGYNAKTGKWAHGDAPRFNLFRRNPDALGDPIAEVKQEVAQLQKVLQKRAPELEVEPEPLIIFMHNTAVLSVKDAPVAIIHHKQLKDHFRKRPTKGPNIAQRLEAALNPVG